MSVSARALLFPGQGAQQVGMGRSVRERSSVAREVFERADEALGWPLSRYQLEGPAGELTRTEVAQPALLTHAIAVLRAVEAEQSPAPFAAAGHSLGEWTALVAAGAMDFEDAVRLVHLRGRLMQEAVPEGVGAMAAVFGLDEATVEALCAEVVGEDELRDRILEPATYNGGRHIVVAGHREAVERFEVLARDKGAMRVTLLDVSAPFHCRLMAPAEVPLREALAETTLRRPAYPVRSTVRDGWLDEPEAIREALVEQLVAPVRWDACLRGLVDAGAEELWALGAARSLARMVERLRLGPRVRAVATGAEVSEEPA